MKLKISAYEIYKQGYLVKLPWELLATSCDQTGGSFFPTTLGMEDKTRGNIFCFISMQFIFVFLLPSLLVAILKEGTTTVAELDPAVVAHLHIWILYISQSKNTKIPKEYSTHSCRMCIGMLTINRQSKYK